MDSRELAAEPLLEPAAALLGRPAGAARAGAPATRATSPRTSPLTVDGLGPRGGHAHTPTSSSSPTRCARGPRWRSRSPPRCSNRREPPTGRVMPEAAGPGPPGPPGALPPEAARLTPAGRVEGARGRRARHIALIRGGAEHAVGDLLGDPVPVVLVLEVVQAMVAPDRAVVARARPIGGVDQKVRPFVGADERVAGERGADRAPAGTGPASEPRAGRPTATTAGRRQQSSPSSFRVEQERRRLLGCHGGCGGRGVVGSSKRAPTDSERLRVQQVDVDRPLAERIDATIAATATASRQPRLADPTRSARATATRGEDHPRRVAAAELARASPSVVTSGPHCAFAPMTVRLRAPTARVATVATQAARLTAREPAAPPGSATRTSRRARGLSSAAKRTRECRHSRRTASRRPRRLEESSYDESAVTTGLTHWRPPLSCVGSLRGNLDADVGWEFDVQLEHGAPV